MRSTSTATNPAKDPPSPRASRGRRLPLVPMVEVRRSRIQGRGVFALRDIAKGERVIEYVGERITHDEASRRYDDSRSRRHHTFLFTLTDEIVLDATREGNDARYVNHSCAPNCEAVIERGRIFIYARKPLTAGDELLYDYWYTTDDTYTDEDLRAVYPCRCGAKNCRGTLAAPRRKKKAAAAPKSQTANAEKPEKAEPGSGRARTRKAG